jgi:hypothetical protein
VTVRWPQPSRAINFRHVITSGTGLIEMLRIVGSGPCERLETEFGEYVPFRIWCEVERSEPSLYWRTGDLKSTMLEIEIRRQDGQISGVSLLLPGKVSAGFPVLTLPEKSLAGLPAVSVAGWPANRFVDDANPFQVSVDSSRLLVLLKASVATELYVADNVTFGACDDGSLAWMLVNNLSHEKMNDLLIG